MIIRHECQQDIAAVKYFIATHQGEVSVVASATASDRAVRALATEELRWRCYSPPVPAEIEIAPKRGLTAAQLGEKWFGYLEHFEFEVSYVVSEAHHDFDIDDPSISRMTPAKFRHYLAQDPDAHFKAPFGDYWKPLMNLLDLRPADRLEFNRAFDRLTSPMLNAYAAAMLPHRARLLRRDHPPFTVIEILTAGYYVNQATASQALFDVDK